MARLDDLFDVLLARKGSDLHLSIGHPPMIRARGELVHIRAKEMDTAEMESLLFEIVTPEQKRRIEDDLDLDFAHGFGQKARFRVNYFHKQTGLAAVFRTIPAEILTLEDLRCPPAIRELAERPAGLLLVTGPTGSGKSTTLAAMIDHINKTRACHVLTIEDPVEFVHKPQKAQITHREVGLDADGFASAIRSAGREDADVILIGELRTNETMKLALELASFGVLVFGTMHTNGAASTIDRILNSFPAEEQPQIRGMLAESLVGVVAQQLVRTADGKGRVAAHEILVGSPALASIIREGNTSQISKLQASQASGMQTTDMALEKLVRSGQVTLDVAIERANDREYLKRLESRMAPIGARD